MSQEARIVPKRLLLNSSGRVIDMTITNPAQSGSGFTLVGMIGAAGRPRTIHNLWYYADDKGTGTGMTLYVGILRAGVSQGLALSGPSGPQQRLVVLGSVVAASMAVGAQVDFDLSTFTDAQRYMAEGDALVALVAATGAWTAAGLRMGAIAIEGRPQ